MRLRAPTPDDAEAVLAVLVARDIADLGEPDFTLADLREEWSASDFDLARDAVLVQDGDGHVLAYAIVRRPGTLVSVAPQHETMGIGAQLLSWAEERESKLGRAVHRQWIGTGNKRAKELLHAAGYSHTRSYRRMVRALDDGDPIGDLPAGIRLRKIDPVGDAPALYAVSDAAFSVLSDYTPGSLEAFAEAHLRAHDLAPELSLAAIDDGVIVGFLLTRRWEDQVGFVDLLAVQPDRQHRGLGSAMLRTAFVRYADAGLHQAQLGVASDNHRAVTLYERVGMREKFRSDTYEKLVRRGQAG